jgi:predicted PurR-regulated permease PerM
MSEQNKIEISTGTILRIILVLLAVWFLYVVRDIILLLFISVVIVAAINPVVSWLDRKWKVSRTIGSLFVFAVIVALVVLAVSFIVPPIITQFHEFSKNAAQYYSWVQGWIGQTGITNLAGNNVGTLSGLSGNIFSTTVGVFSGVISAVVVLSMAFYMSIEEDGIRQFIVSVTPEKHKKYASDLTARIERKIGKWMLGQVALMFLIFVFDYIGLRLVGIPYALTLAFLAGLLEIVPYIGPIVSAIPGILIGLMISPVKGILAFLVYFIAQHLETNIIVPQIMKKAVGLNPVTTILAILVGFSLAGVLGALISVPVATALSLVISDFMGRN